MHKLKPLTLLKRDVESHVGHNIATDYRRIYTGAIDGKYPAEQVNGRWHYNPANVPAIAEVIVGDDENTAS